MNPRVQLALALLALSALAIVIVAATSRSNDSAGTVAPTGFEGALFPSGVRAPDFGLRDDHTGVVGLTGRAVGNSTERYRRRLIRERLGHKVTLEPLPEAAWPTAQEFIFDSVARAGAIASDTRRFSSRRIAIATARSVRVLGPPRGVARLPA